MQKGDRIKVLNNKYEGTIIRIYQEVSKKTIYSMAVVVVDDETIQETLADDNHFVLSSYPNKDGLASTFV